MDILTIVLAATLGFIIAFLWNGPLFGKLGRRLAQQDAAGDIAPPKISQIVLNYLVFLVTAAVMSGVFWLVFNSTVMGPRTWYRGTIIALWLWLGFNVMATSIAVIWQGKPWKSWLFECAAAAVVFSVMGAVLGGL